MAHASLPSAPLAAAIDRLVDRAQRAVDEPNGIARKLAYQELAVNPRMVYAWRAQTYPTVTLAVADRILSHSPYLWFDVWRECAEHEGPERGCAACEAHYKARLAFTGKRVPRALGGKA
jgi:hypothetical protein